MWRASERASPSHALTPGPARRGAPRRRCWGAPSPAAPGLPARPPPPRAPGPPALTLGAAPAPCALVEQREAAAPRSGNGARPSRRRAGRWRRLDWLRQPRSRRPPGPARTPARARLGAPHHLRLTKGSEPPGAPERAPRPCDPRRAAQGVRAAGPLGAPGRAGGGRPRLRLGLRGATPKGTRTRPRKARRRPGLRRALPLPRCPRETEAQRGKDGWIPSSPWPGPSLLAFRGSVCRS